MKTHELAKALNILAKALRAAPNMPLDALENALGSPKNSGTADIAVSLSTLASLSSYGKSEWFSIIEEYNLPIEIRPRDAARDVLGKILKYLEENASERERVAREAQNRSKTSSELNNALRFLLNNG
jgi:hypothetical protein